jgi:hypothetical protein
MPVRQKCNDEVAVTVARKAGQNCLHGQPNLQSYPVNLLRAFDANRDRIYGIAPQVYVRDATISSNPTFDVASMAGRGRSERIVYQRFGTPSQHYCI